MPETIPRPKIHPSARIHKTAAVHPSATIAEGVRIGPRVKIGSGAIIGADTRIDGAAEIGRNVDISNGHLRIGHHAWVGDDTRIESTPRTTRTKAGEHALAELKIHESRKNSGLPPHLRDSDDRLQWSINGDGRLKVSVDAGYDTKGKKITAEFTDPEQLDRWLDENTPTLGERADPNASRMGPMRMGDPGPARKPDYTIGPESHVGARCIIQSGCHIGTNVRVGNNAYLQSNCRLEDHIEIQSDRDYELGDGTVERASTYIGPGTKVQAKVQIEKGCWVGAGGYLKTGCHLGAGTLTDSLSTIEEHTEIPNESRIGFKALTKGDNNINEQRTRTRIAEERTDARNEIEGLARIRNAGGTGISPNARIDAEAEAHPEATIMAGADIEAGVKIGKGAVIGPDARVRRNCIIGDGAIIAEKTMVRDATYVGKNVEVERRCIITNGTKLQDCPTGTTPTRIGAQTLITGSEIEPGARIGAGCQADYKSKIQGGAQIGAHSLVRGTVGREATVGTDTILMTGTVIGDKATVGDRGVVWDHSEVEANAIVEPGRNVAPSDEGDEKNKVRIKAPSTERSQRQQSPVRGKGRAVGGTPATAPARDSARTR